MKKKFFLGAAVIAAMALSCYKGLGYMVAEDNLSAIQLANIEALGCDECTSGNSESTITAECDPISVVVISKCVVFCPRCYKQWYPSNLATGKTDITTISGRCTCGYSF
ncbi:MAG: hypothetical protein NC082_08425 [Clostridiales bacterium]|nr:hypothetical protein [Clostridiales bacterium]